jgi:hypothetical protein
VCGGSFILKKKGISGVNQIGFDLGRIELNETKYLKGEGYGASISGNQLRGIGNESVESQKEVFRAQV